MKSHAREKLKISPEAESLVPQVVLPEPLVISDADNKISVVQVQSKQKQLYEGVSVARPHECWVCHAAFKKVSHLKQHYRRHTGERPYKCSKCDRWFTSNSVLKFHLHTHDDARPYSCSMCDTKFLTRGSMKRHLVTHSNKRSYMCPYCQKTFKTNVSCRKHIKSHKHELAQQQLEEQKTQNQKEPQPLSEDKGATSALPGSITLDEDMKVSFQPQMAPDTQAFSDQFQSLNAEEEKSFLLPDNATSLIVNQNLSVGTTILGTSQTLHADETGTITLPNYSGDQTLTPEIKREIEETLNQQLFNIDMNLGLGANNLPRQMDEANTSSLNNSREQPVLNIIYEQNKNLESSSNTIFMSQFDSFDMNQIKLQTDNDMDIDLNPTNSTSMSSILPRSMGNNQQEEQRAAPVTTNSNVDASQITRNTHLVVISPKENCSELVRQLSQVSPSKYSKVIAKADTTNGSEIQGTSEHEKTMQKSSTVSRENEKNSLFMKNFQSTIQSETLVSSDMNSSVGCDTLLQCHMCDDRGFTTERLKEHLKTHNRGAKEFECWECSQRFYTNGGLNRHVKKLKHTKQRWRCATCQKTLGSKQQLKFHNKMHTESWNVSSTEPDGSEKDLASSNPGLSGIITTLYTRDPNPVSEKVLMETVAERKSIDRVDENAEKKETREYTNKCKYCPKTFGKPSDLVRHIRTHTGERPYKCDHCNKSFAVKCTLETHMKVHTGKKTFCCHVCSSMLATKGSLKVHMRLHTGSKPFQCPVCDLRFRTSGHKKVHLLKHARQFMSLLGGKPKRSKIAAVEEAAASLEKVDNSSLDNASTTMTTTPAMINETASSQNLDYPAS